MRHTWIIAFLASTGAIAQTYNTNDPRAGFSLGSQGGATVTNPTHVNKATQASQQSSTVTDERAKNWTTGVQQPSNQDIERNRDRMKSVVKYKRIEPIPNLRECTWHELSLAQAGYGDPNLVPYYLTPEQVQLLRIKRATAAANAAVNAVRPANTKTTEAIYLDSVTGRPVDVSVSTTTTTTYDPVTASLIANGYYPVGYNASRPPTCLVVPAY